MTTPSRPDAAAPPADPVPPPVADYDEHGVPTFDHVRDKIEGRYATALGTDELVADTPEGRSVAEQERARDEAAARKLDELRRSVRGGSGGGSPNAT